MPSITANAEAGPSNTTRGTHRYQRLRFPSPLINDRRISKRLLDSKDYSNANLPLPKARERYTWPPRGRFIDRRMEGNKIITQRAPLTTNFLREYANGVIDERQRLLQRKLDIMERAKTAVWASKIASVRSAESNAKVARFMAQLNEMMRRVEPEGDLEGGEEEGVSGREYEAPHPKRQPDGGLTTKHRLGDPTSKEMDMSTIESQSANPKSIVEKGKESAIYPYKRKRAQDEDEEDEVERSIHMAYRPDSFHSDRATSSSSPR